jgi:hypothetical protein
MAARQRRERIEFQRATGAKVNEKSGHGIWVTPFD